MSVAAVATKVARSPSEVDIILAMLEAKRDRDHLKLASNKKIFKLLRRLREKDLSQGLVTADEEERVVFSELVTKINRHKAKQQRVLLLTNVALYNITENYKTCKRRILIKLIEKVTLSESEDDFLVHVAGEYDYHYRSYRRSEIVHTIAQLREQAGLPKLQIFVAPQDDIASHLVTKQLALVWQQDGYHLVANEGGSSSVSSATATTVSKSTSDTAVVAGQQRIQQQQQQQEEQQQQQQQPREESKVRFAEDSKQHDAAGDGNDENAQPEQETSLQRQGSESGNNRTRGFTPFQKIRQLVSKKKRRFQEDGFDLDLTYVTDRLIAMGYPSEGAEGMYRNPYPEVYRFLEQRHKGHYKVYNLCSERRYDPIKFHHRVAIFPFDDHNCPSIRLILEFCQDVSQYLAQHPSNVVAVHCKAGKGRTGLMLSAYMVWAEMFPATAESLTFFGDQRTKNGKGVTIPSQRRYVGYFQRFLRDHYGPKRPFPYVGVSMVLTKVRITTVPRIDRMRGCNPYFKILSLEGAKLYDSRQIQPVHNYRDEKHIDIRASARVSGDVKVVFYDEDKYGTDEKLFWCWFNTNFIDDNHIVMRKFEIDKPHKDKKHKKFDAGLMLEFSFRPDDIVVERANDDVVRNTTAHRKKRQLSYDSRLHHAPGQRHALRQHQRHARRNINNGKKKKKKKHAVMFGPRALVSMKSSAFLLAKDPSQKGRLMSQSTVAPTGAGQTDAAAAASATTVPTPGGGTVNVADSNNASFSWTAADIAKRIKELEAQNQAQQAELERLRGKQQRA